MPTRLSAPVGAPCWVDLQTSDTDQAREFYGSLFGWTAGDPSPEFGGYFMFLLDGMPVAGGMQADEQAPVSDVWSIYLSVENAAETLDSAVGHGGQVIVPPMQIADLGSMGFLIDSGQAGVGLWQPDQFPGFGNIAEPGAPSWFEVYTRDYDGTVAFYRDVFGWDVHVVSDTPQFRYSTMKEPGGDGWLAGVMDGAGSLPEDVPAHWAVYFGVPDADAAVARVVELGGSVVQPPEDTPYGRLASVTDATGAGFKLVAGR
jgi:predicted enzyme related to lactoylglutathione lyase